VTLPRTHAPPARRSIHSRGPCRLASRPLDVMPTYQFTARAATGETRTGEIELPDRRDLDRYLRQRRLKPISVRIRGSRPTLLRKLTGGRRAVAGFLRQLGSLVEAGIPLASALDLLAEQLPDPAMAEVTGRISQSIRGGSSFADALREHPHFFDAFTLALIEAGEAGGALDHVLDRLATHHETRQRLDRKLRGALAYPAVVLTTAVAVTIGLLWKVVPVFATVFAEAGIPLPLPTRVVLGASDLVRGAGPAMIVGAVIGWLLIRRYGRTPAGRLRLDRAFVRAPFMGPLLLQAGAARVTRALAILVTAGVPILEGLRIAAAAAGNRAVHDAVLAARASIEEGGSIAAPLVASDAFPTLAARMIQIGEQTGRLDEMLDRVASRYEEEIDATVETLTSMVEPAVVVLLGIIVGGLVVAMYLPMFEVMRGVG